jgi:hypothetical protein
VEPFTGLKPLIAHPGFREDRQRCLENLDLGAIDGPLRDIIEAFSKVSSCFTQQCCWGHFLSLESCDPLNVEPLNPGSGIITVEYRIAYLALCVENSEAGRSLLGGLGSIVALDPDYIQFGCGQWFWDNMQVNSYALQVEPVRFQHYDTAILSIEEALHVQETRDRVFDAVREIPVRMLDLADIH